MTDVVTAHARRGGLLLQVAFLACTRAAVLIAAVATFALLGPAWVFSLLGGGSQTPWPHAFYAAIIVAAVRFSWPRALFAAVAAGLLAGPALPVSTATGQAQDPQAWSLRLLAFTVIGVFVAALVRQRVGAGSNRAQDSLLSYRLVRAVHAGQVHYQPICDLHTGEVVAVEALARWQDPPRGPVSPAVFVPPAERTGMITVLDRFVLRAALAQAHHWRAQLGRPVKIAILQQAGVTHGQGFHLARPAPPAAIEALLLAGAAHHPVAAQHAR